METSCSPSDFLQEIIANKCNNESPHYLSFLPVGTTSENNVRYRHFFQSLLHLLFIIILLFFLYLLLLKQSLDVLECVDYAARRRIALVAEQFMQQFRKPRRLFCFSNETDILFILHNEIFIWWKWFLSSLHAANVVTFHLQIFSKQFTLLNSIFRCRLRQGILRICLTFSLSIECRILFWI